MLHSSDPVTAFRRDGYFVVRAFLGPADRSVLRLACDAALERERARSKESGGSTPRIDLVDVEPAFAFFGSQRVSRMLLDLQPPAQPSIPQLKAVHYYHEQATRDWDGDWHRDSQFSLAVLTDPEAERTIVQSTTQVHFRVAFEPDDRLEIVPGSHARWDTPEEERIRRGSDRATASMPNALRIALSPGDACVFHAFSIHRATYRRSPRRTLDALYAYR